MTLRAVTLGSCLWLGSACGSALDPDCDAAQSSCAAQSTGDDVACDDPSQCDEPAETCFYGFCRELCDSVDYDCREGGCVEGVCLEAGEPGSVCNYHGECGPGGYCPDGVCLSTSG